MAAKAKPDNSQEIAALQGQQAQANAEISQTEAEIERIQAKIERLKAAKTKVKEEKSALESLEWTKVSTLSGIACCGCGMQGCVCWKGQHYNAFTVHAYEGIVTEFRQMLRDVDDTLDQLCDEITRLENQLNEQNGLLGRLKSWLNSIGNELAKLFN